MIMFGVAKSIKALADAIEGYVTWLRTGRGLVTKEDLAEAEGRILGAIQEQNEAALTRMTGILKSSATDLGAAVAGAGAKVK